MQSLIHLVMTPASVLGVAVLVRWLMLYAIAQIVLRDTNPAQRAVLLGKLTDFTQVVLSPGRRTRSRGRHDS